jgi:hypothetical protein
VTDGTIEVLLKLGLVGAKRMCGHLPEQWLYGEHSWNKSRLPGSQPLADIVFCPGVHSVRRTVNLFTLVFVSVIVSAVVSAVIVEKVSVT